MANEIGHWQAAVVNRGAQQETAHQDQRTKDLYPPHVGLDLNLRNCACIALHTPVYGMVVAQADHAAKHILGGVSSLKSRDWKGAISHLCGAVKAVTIQCVSASLFEMSVSNPLSWVSSAFPESIPVGYWASWVPAAAGLWLAHEHPLEVRVEMQRLREMLSLTPFESLVAGGGYWIFTQTEDPVTKVAIPVLVVADKFFGFLANHPQVQAFNAEYEDNSPGWLEWLGLGRIVKAIHHSGEDGTTTVSYGAVKIAQPSSEGR